MADEQANPAAGSAEAQAPQRPTFMLKAQYIKDLSFENPGAPEIYTKRTEQTPVSIKLDVNSHPISAADHYEVLLSLEARAEGGETTLFIVELTFGGIFELSKVEERHVDALLFIEGGRLLFPFARRILADCTRECGFPPLLVNPVDFTVLFNEKHGRPLYSAPIDPSSAGS